MIICLNELELMLLHTSIAIVSTQLNGFNYCYLTVICLFNIDNLFPHTKMVTILLFNTAKYKNEPIPTRNSNKHKC